MQISVEDTGVGIPKQKLESIFNSFTQAEESTSRKYGGSGLGTTIAKQLVTLMNGEIWVESPSSISTKSKYPGAKFNFTVEVYSNEKLKKNIDLSKIKVYKKLNALIITKDSEDKKRLIKILDLYGINHNVFKYQEDKQESLTDLLKNNFQEYHILIILDEPNFNGLQIAKILVENTISDKFLTFMFSSNHKTDNYIQSKRAEIDYYMTQPFEQDDFIGYLEDNLPNVAKVIDIEQKVVRQDLSILVAEDNLINQKVAETIFGNLGFKIEISPDGADTVERVKQKEYDIIFMDILMPEKDGIQATVDIRGMGYQMPIVAMTATSSKKGRHKAISSGMNDYVIKPFKMDTIKKVLIKWFG